MSFSVLICSLCSLVYNVFLFYFLLFVWFLFVFLFVFSHYLQGFDELNNIHLVCACMIDTDQKLNVTVCQKRQASTMNVNNA